MLDINLTTSIETLSINGIYNPIKRQRLSDWVKNKTQLYGVYRKHIRFKDTQRLKVKQ